MKSTKIAPISTTACKPKKYKSGHTNSTNARTNASSDMSSHATPRSSSNHPKDSDNEEEESEVKVLRASSDHEANKEDLPIPLWIEFEVPSSENDKNDKNDNRSECTPWERKTLYKLKHRRRSGTSSATNESWDVFTPNDLTDVREKANHPASSMRLLAKSLTASGTSGITAKTASLTKATMSTKATKSTKSMSTSTVTPTLIPASALPLVLPSIPSSATASQREEAISTTGVTSAMTAEVIPANTTNPINSTNNTNSTNSTKTPLYKPRRSSLSRSHHLGSQNCKFLRPRTSSQSSQTSRHSQLSQSLSQSLSLVRSPSMKQLVPSESQENHDTHSNNAKDVTSVKGSNHPEPPNPPNQSNRHHRSSSALSYSFSSTSRFLKGGSAAKTASIGKTLLRNGSFLLDGMDGDDEDSGLGFDLVR